MCFQQGVEAEPGFWGQDWGGLRQAPGESSCSRTRRSRGSCGQAFPQHQCSCPAPQNVPCWKDLGWDPPGPTQDATPCRPPYISLTQSSLSSKGNGLKPSTLLLHTARVSPLQPLGSQVVSWPVFHIDQEQSTLGSQPSCAGCGVLLQQAAVLPSSHLLLFAQKQKAVCTFPSAEDHACTTIYACAMGLPPDTAQVRGRLHAFFHLTGESSTPTSQLPSATPVRKFPMGT